MAKHRTDPANTPQYILVRFRQNPGDDNVATLLTSSKWGMAYEIFNFMGENPGNPDIETGLQRWVPNSLDGVLPDGGRNEHYYHQEASRSALNLCMMLTHYGCRLGGPVDPDGYERHRRKKDLAHMRTGDALRIVQDRTIVIRQSRPVLADAAEQGPPTGRTFGPQWRRGHWRRRPGWEAFVERGESPPMVLIRPNLTHAGDAGQMGQTVYEMR